MILHKRDKPKGSDFYVDEIKFEEIEIIFSKPSKAEEMNKIQKDFFILFFLNVLLSFLSIVLLPLKYNLGNFDYLIKMLVQMRCLD